MSEPAGASDQPSVSRPTKPRDELSLPLMKRALRAIYFPKPAPVTFDGGPPWNELYPHVRSVIGDAPLTYLEFGVFRGNSLRRMAAHFGNPQSRFFGFDSFEGLPEDWGKIKKSGFSRNGSLPPVDDSRIGFVKGYFQNTVPSFMAENRFDTPVLVHFDADLYSSTLFLLTMLWNHLPEYYFIFDEFWPDEAVALYDFMLAYPVEVEFIAACVHNSNPNRPYHVFGRMRNISYQPPK